MLFLNRTNGTKHEPIIISLSNPNRIEMGLPTQFNSLPENTELNRLDFGLAAREEHDSSASIVNKSLSLSLFLLRFSVLRSPDRFIISQIQQVFNYIFTVSHRTSEPLFCSSSSSGFLLIT